MGSIVSREELRRLEKAAREKDKRKLADWIKQFERYLDTMLQRDFEEAFQKELDNSLQNILTAVAYTAYYSEESYVDKENIADYMSDLFATLDLIRNGEYKPEEYKEALAKENVFLEDYDSDLIYKKYLNIFDSDLVKYFKGNHRKVVTICGSSKFKNEIIQAQEDLTLRGNIVLTKGIFIEADNLHLIPEEVKQTDIIQKEKILISDLIYVVNKDGFIDEETQSDIDYAKEHNKEIWYLESIE